MDEFFFLPPSPAAMPRAYWLPQHGVLTSALIVLQPFAREWQRIQEYMTRDNPGYDMEILNAIYNESAIVLPHHRYFLLSAEFRNKDHSKYLSSNAPWDAEKALGEAKYVHFYDWPAPKPWLRPLDSMMVDSLIRPKCTKTMEGRMWDCTDQRVWLRLYSDFQKRGSVSAVLKRVEWVADCAVENLWPKIRWLWMSTSLGTKCRENVVTAAASSWARPLLRKPNP